MTKEEDDAEAELLINSRNRVLSFIVVGGVVLLSVIAMIFVVFITKEPSPQAPSVEQVDGKPAAKPIDY